MKSKVSTPCPAPEQERSLPGDIQGWSLLSLIFNPLFLSPQCCFPEAPFCCSKCLYQLTPGRHEQGGGEGKVAA